MQSEIPSEFPCEAMIEMTYDSALTESGDDYNEQDEDSLQGVIGESRDTVILESLSDVPRGYKIAAWEAIDEDSEELL